MSSSELLMRICELKQSLAAVESMLRLLLERSILEEEPLPDEVETIEAEDELVELEKLKKELAKKKGGGLHW